MKKLIFLFFIPILLSSCISSPNNGSGSNDVDSLLVPLTVGNYWDYELANTSVRRDLIYTKEVIDSQDVYFFWTDYGSWTGSRAIYNTQKGYYETRYWNIDLNNSMYYFKCPVMVGDTWENTYVFDHGWTHKYECLSKNAKVDVPAGTFNCILYEVINQAGDGDYLHHYYFKPGIGLIAIKEVVSDSSGQKEEWEKKLNSYCLVK